METKAIENKKLSLRESLAEAKAEAEAQAKEAESQAREKAEGAIQAAFWEGKIDLTDAETLADYIDTLTPDVLVTIPDVAQMLIHYRAKVEADAKAKDVAATPKGDSRRNWCLLRVRQNPGMYTMRQLNDEADKNPVWGNYTTKASGLLSEGFFQTEKGQTVKIGQDLPLFPTTKLIAAKL